MNSMFCRRAFAFLFVAGILLVHTSAYADTNATVSGLVTDPQGRAVVDTAIVLTNVNTGIAYQTKTNGEGIYRLNGLQPGIYRANVSKDGFKSIVKADIELHVQDQLSINYALQLGSVTETITVEAGAPLVNTEDATVSTVVDRQFAENLPMNGRSFQTLIRLTPGVVDVTSNPVDGGQFSINGQRATSNYWMVDGVSANVGVSSNFNAGNGAGGALGSFSALGGTNGLVSVDAMQEFRIQTSTYAPEFGRTPGGQISIVTRSGTNQFHGNAFNYLRNDVFDASDWFNGFINNPRLPKGQDRQNDFGGTLSGPILKGRTFFFFSYEGLRLRLPQTSLTLVPDDSTVAGGLNARQNALPALQPYLNAFPLPNGPEILDVNQQPTGAAQLNASFSNKATLDAYGIRVDHRLGNRMLLFGRYNFSPSEILQRESGGFEALSVLQQNRITTQTATVGATTTISPAVSNDLRFNYSRTSASSNKYLDSFRGAVPLASLPLPSPLTSKAALFGIFIISLGRGQELDVGHLATNLQRQFNVVDNASVQKGSHSLKFGIDFRRLSPLIAPTSYLQDAVFLDVPSAEIGDTSAGLTQSNAGATLLFRNLGVFAQDTWRVVPRLTLTYGLRWDVDVAPSSLHGPSIPAVTGYNLNDLSHLAIAPAGTPPFRTKYGNVAPRLGLAYQLTQNQDWRMVLRGGFGVFFDLATSETGISLAGSPGAPFTGTNFNVNGPFPFAASEIAPPVIASTADIARFFTFNPDLKLPYTLEWNIALEQALGGKQTLSASYVGATGRRLLQTLGVSTPRTNPNISFGNFVDNRATSDFDALQVQYQRRLSRGLQVLASYSWSHSIDSGSAGSIGKVSNAGVLGSPNANRGPSDFDIRNAFSAGVTYDVPAPKSVGFVRAFVRGWSLQGLIVARSSAPVDVSDGIFQVFNNGIFADVRPDLVPGEPLYLHGSQCSAALVQPLVSNGQPVPPCPGGKGFNPAAFADPPYDPNTFIPLQQGNVPRNFLRGFGATQVDFAVHRDFAIHESLKLQFRAEMFNVLNHPNFGPPSPLFVSSTFGGNPGFGVSSQMLGQSLTDGNLGGGALNPLYQIGGPRSMQLALKMEF